MEVNDAQRGAGYFARKMDGVTRARTHGLEVGCIATFTPGSLPQWRRVFGNALVGDEREED